MSETIFICYEDYEEYSFHFLYPNGEKIPSSKVEAKFKILENDILNGYKIIITNNYKKIAKKPLSYVLKWDELLIFSFKDFFRVDK